MRSALVVASLVAVLASCSSDDGRELADARDPLPSTTTTTSVAADATIALSAPWRPGEPLPERYRCGTDVAVPALTWGDVPVGTIELAVAFVVDGTVEHVLAGIDPTADGLDEAAIPPGSFWWPPTDLDARWPGLCGDDAASDYDFTVYALNQQLEAADDSAVTEVIGLLALTAIADATVSGQLDLPST